MRWIPFSKSSRRDFLRWGDSGIVIAKTAVRTLAILGTTLSVLLAPLTLQAAPVPVPAALEGGEYEEAPVLAASRILQPGYYHGPYHRVREAVPTYSGANHYVIDSDFGVFEAEGNLLLEQRVAEIYAIAKLQEMSLGDEYQNALKEAAKSPLVVARNLAKNPVGTVSSVPKGIWKFMNRAGQGIKEAAGGRKRTEYEDNMLEDFSGMSKAKRELAAQVGVNPYSSNEVLQRELNRIAWASVAGNVTISALSMGLTGGASVVIASVGISKTTSEVLRDTDPNDLRRLNTAALVEMGIKKADAEAFMAAPAYSPWHQTYMVQALKVLEGVKGRDALLRAATENASDEAEALFYAHTAHLIGLLHQGTIPVESIIIFHGLPVCVAKDGRAVIALQWDYAAWTEPTARFVAALKDFNAKEPVVKPKKGKQPAQREGWLVAISGQASPLFQQQMAAIGVEVWERLAPGPLK